MAGTGIIKVAELSDHPIDAAAYFHDVYAPKVRAMAVDGDVTVVFVPADFTHARWREGVIRELAREAVPMRVNAIVADDAKAMAKTLDFLKSADGVTGQVFRTDSNS